MQSKRGMGRQSSAAITARFTNEETTVINQHCETTKIPRSIFIHDVVVAAIEKLKV